MLVDLHTHTTASDGKLNPLELLQYAEKKGLSALAITDHDTVDGAMSAAQKISSFQLELIIGVELNTVWNQREIHMLGYFIDPANQSLQQQLEIQRKMRMARPKKIVDRLNELGIPLNIEEILRELNLASTRDLLVSHIARMLVRKGIVTSQREAFHRYIGKQKPAYVLPTSLTPLQAIHLIHKTGGVAVVAHPGIYQEEGLIPDLVRMGLDGVEVFHPDHNEAERKRYMRLSKEFDLIVTGGSDFHGEKNGKMFHSDLGSQVRYLEQNILDQLREKKRKKKSF